MPKKLPWSRKMYLMLTAGAATAFVSSCACSANAGIEKMPIEIGTNLDTGLHLGGSGYQTEIKQFMIQVAHYYGNEVCRQNNREFLAQTKDQNGNEPFKWPSDDNVKSFCKIYDSGRSGKDNNGLPFLSLQWVGSKNKLEVVGKYDEKSKSWDGKLPSEVVNEQLTTSYYFRYGKAHYDSGEGSGVWDNPASLGNADEDDFNKLKGDPGLTISIAFSENAGVGNFDGNDNSPNSTGTLNLPQSSDPTYPDFNIGTLILNEATREWLNNYFTVTSISWNSVVD